MSGADLSEGTGIGRSWYAGNAFSGYKSIAVNRFERTTLPIEGTTDIGGGEISLSLDKVSGADPVSYEVFVSRTSERTGKQLTQYDQKIERNLSEMIWWLSTSLSIRTKSPSDPDGDTCITDLSGQIRREYLVHQRRNSEEIRNHLLSIMTLPNHELNPEYASRVVECYQLNFIEIFQAEALGSRVFSLPGRIAYDYANKYLKKCTQFENDIRGIRRQQKVFQWKEPLQELPMWHWILRQHKEDPRMGKRERLLYQVQFFFMTAENISVWVRQNALTESSLRDHRSFHREGSGDR